jgi:hypothetical protein
MPRKQEQHAQMPQNRRKHAKGCKGIQCEVKPATKSNSLISAAKETGYGA